MHRQDLCPASRRRASPDIRRSRRRPNAQRQYGAIAIMLALMMLVILYFCGIAVDVGRLVNRKTELQGMANAVALSAARELDGTATGVGRARTAAETTAARWHYQYNTQPVAWRDNALAFSTGASGAWLDAGAAAASPDGLLYAKVDTRELATAHGSVGLALIPALSGGASTVDMSTTAVAGRMTINITPMAVCALSPVPAASRTNPGPPANQELVEFGFRRGVSYDLMQLNPSGTTPENFALDPLAIPGTTGSSSNTAPTLLGPFVCSGMLAMPRVTGGTVTASRPFPLGALYSHLNSRFGHYAGRACTPDTAPPDSNIRSYPYTAIPWMSAAPSGQAAQSTTDSGKLWTVADPLPALTGNTAAMYGPLWAYARAVPFGSYTAGAGVPATGYTPFATSAWATLYRPGQPTASASYPGGTSVPYKATAGANFQAPPVAYQPGVANRRVLHVPLLACPLGSGTMVSATVIGIGKFFMTVPATTTSLVAEFAGVAAEQSLGGQVELVR